MGITSQEILEALAISQCCAAQYTYAVLAVDGQSRSELLGSCVIIEYRSKSYFVTAGHIMREATKANKGIMLVANGRSVSLTGQFVITEAEDDNLDIGIMSLSDVFIVEHGLNVVKEELMLPWDFVEKVAYGFSHGYPLSRNKQPKIMLKASITAYAYAGKFFDDEALFEKHKKSVLRHTCLSYGNNAQNNKPVKPKGKSGSGVWYVKSFREADSIYLDSILIEYFEKSRVVFSTKILWIFKIIDQHW